MDLELNRVNIKEYITTSSRKDILMSDSYEISSCFNRGPGMELERPRAKREAHLHSFYRKCCQWQRNYEEVGGSWWLTWRLLCSNGLSHLMNSYSDNPSSALGEEFKLICLSKKISFVLKRKTVLSFAKKARKTWFQMTTGRLKNNTRSFCFVKKRFDGILTRRMQAEPNRRWILFDGPRVIFSSTIFSPVSSSFPTKIIVPAHQPGYSSLFPMPA